MTSQRRLLVALMTACAGVMIACGTSGPRKPKAAKQQEQAARLEEARQPEILTGVVSTVLNEQIVPGIKRTLDVRLNRRVSEAALRSLAVELKNSDPKSYKRTFILYYLPDMKVGERAWATTHFTPDLEVRILGTTKEAHERLEKEAAVPAKENVIGRWRDNETGFPGVIVFTNEGGKVFMTKTFADGSKGRYELTVRKVGSQTRYAKKDEKLGDYLVITAEGDLAHGDAEEGIWATSKKIK